MGIGIPLGPFPDDFGEVAGVFAFHKGPAGSFDGVPGGFEVASPSRRGIDDVEEGPFAEGRKGGGESDVHDAPRGEVVSGKLLVASRTS